MSVQLFDVVLLVQHGRHVAVIWSHLGAGVKNNLFSFVIATKISEFTDSFCKLDGLTELGKIM
jgi:hypothetical protein